MQVLTEATGVPVTQDTEYIHQDGETSQGIPEEYDWSFDAVRVNYINLNSVKSISFSQLRIKRKSKADRNNV